MRSQTCGGGGGGGGAISKNDSFLEKFHCSLIIIIFDVF